MTSGAVTIALTGQTLVLSSVTHNGGAQTPYTDSTLVTPVTLPVTLTADTTYWFNQGASDKSYTFAFAQIDGTSLSITRTVGLGSPQTISPIPTVAQIAADVSGISGGGGHSGLNASRIVGSTSTGAPPTSGTFAVGDVVLDTLYGVEYLCTVAGTPGTWVTLGSGRTLGLSKTTSASAAIGSTATELAVIASITVTAGPLPLVISARTNNTSGLTATGLVTFACFDEAFTDVFQDSFVAVAAAGRGMSLETTESYPVGTVKTFHLYGRCQTAGTAVFGTATGATCTWLKVALG